MNETIDRHEVLVSREMRSPLGALTLVADANALVGVYFERHRPAPRTFAVRHAKSLVLEEAETELASFFAHAAHPFTVRTNARGTDLERAVWSELTRIPRGQTCTYGALAARLGRPTAARAVGSAIARNPLSIVVPCHRVVGASGSLTGFAGGIERKAWLLAHEGARVGALDRSARLAGPTQLCRVRFADDSGRAQG